MKISMIQTKTFSRLAVLLVVLGFSCMAVGQSNSGVFTIGFYVGGNAGLPDAQMHVVNPGSTGGYGSATETPTAIPQGGDLCANVYVFTPDEEMIACCSCKVSPNGMQGFSLATDLIVAPLTSDVPHAGAIKIVASEGGGRSGNTGVPPAGPSAATPSGLACDAGSFYVPGGNLDTWITHVRPLGASVGVTEANFQTAPLSESEYVKLVTQCFLIESAPGVGGVGGGKALKSRPEKSSALAAKDTTAPVNCTPFPAIFNGGAGGPTPVSCPPFTPAAGQTLTGVTLTYVADYQFGLQAAQVVNVTFAPAGPAGVTWSPSSTTLMVMGAGSSGAEPTSTASATAGVSNAAFASAYNVNVSSAIMTGAVATSSGAVSVVYTFSAAPPPPPPPPTRNCNCDPAKAR